MECTKLVDPHQLLCHWFTVVFVLFCIYTPTICSQDRLSTKAEVDHLFSVTRHAIGQFFSGNLQYAAIFSDFVSYLVFISSIRVDPGPTNRGLTSLLALKIRTPMANTGKLRSIGQMPVAHRGQVEDRDNSFTCVRNSTSSTLDPSTDFSQMFFDRFILIAS